MPDSSPPQGWDSLPPDLRDTAFMRVARELTRVKDETRMLVMVANGFLELLVNALIDEKCKHASKIVSNTRDFSYSTKLILLHEMGVLSNTSFANLNWFRKLRNRAAHEAVFSVTREDLSDILEHPPITDKSLRDPEHFHLLSLLIVMTLWNEHLAIFGPRFLPSEFRKDKEARP